MFRSVLTSLMFDSSIFCLVACFTVYGWFVVSAVSDDVEPSVGVVVSVISGVTGDSGFDGVVGFGGSEGVMVSGGTGVAGTPMVSRVLESP